MTEARDVRLRRLKMRSWRRGTKEMDMILGPFFDASSGDLSDETLDHYETLLDENDQDLYQWVSGQIEPPAQFSVLVGTIRTYALSS
ncbi:MAG: succinate dehydrogenase assembly factor 2 [Boseongicola sp.]|nr:MAG: succinate dehydrogenase assembly factor 2 [Boseongicola sp.]